MTVIAGEKPALIWALRLSVVLLVGLWLFPTLGLLVSSFRTSDQIATSGWWRAMFPSEQNLTLRTNPPSAQVQEGDRYVIEGRLFAEGTSSEISAWGTSARDPAAYEPGISAELRRGGTLTVTEDGAYRLESTEEISGKRGPRVFVTATEIGRAHV